LPASSLQNIIICLPFENNNNKFTSVPPFHLNQQTKNMKPGAFSVSLNVKDINASKEFYAHIGFNIFAGGYQKELPDNEKWNGHYRAISRYV